MASVEGTAPTPADIRKVIIASSLGTLIEWYDFYLFGVLAAVLGTNFFPKGNDFAALLNTLAIFAVGFVVRPFGALVFGRLGDLAGRKISFLITLLMMGFSTFAIGLLPTYAQVGAIAPILMLVLRIVQGLAVGGEYGGAATYVAEHAPDGKRGFYTSFIQITATMGLFVALIVIQLTRTSVGEAQFNANGWRIPFLLSAILVVFSYVIRRTMHESPAFLRAKSHGKVSSNPLVESFVKPENRKLVLLALFGATAGQGVIWYTSQFYANTFMQKSMGIAAPSANSIVAWALIIGTPFFVLVGWLSDRVGRKKLIMLGCLLAALAYFPIYKSMMNVTGDFEERIELRAETSGTQVDKTVNHIMEDGSSRKTVIKHEAGSKKIDVTETITPGPKDQRMLILLVLIQVLLVTLVYGPMAAFLVELFPTHIRYTSMSLPYHIGNGVFGGLVPLIATKLAGEGATAQPLKGLMYPIAVAAVTLIVGSLFLKEPQRETFAED